MSGGALGDPREAGYSRAQLFGGNESLLVHNTCTPPEILKQVLEIVRLFDHGLDVEDGRAVDHFDWADEHDVALNG